MEVVTVYHTNEGGGCFKHKGKMYPFYRASLTRERAEDLVTHRNFISVPDKEMKEHEPKFTGVRFYVKPRQR